MCVISDKIKFCTCVDPKTDIYELNHYWVLNRYNKQKNLIVMGQFMPSENKFTDNYQQNELKISNALNEAESFDKPISFRQKDRLQIVLNNAIENIRDKMEFEFEYKSGSWHRVVEEDPFYISSHFDEIHSGELKEMD